MPDKIEICDGVCPLCGDECLEYGEVEYTENKRFSRWTCPNCKATGIEYFNDSFMGHYDVVDTEGVHHCFELEEDKSSFDNLDYKVGQVLYTIDKINEESNTIINFQEYIIKSVLVQLKNNEVRIINLSVFNKDDEDDNYVLLPSKIDAMNWQGLFTSTELLEEVYAKFN